MNTQTYYQEFSRQIDRVFSSHPQSFDHRPHHPWLTGALGDPFVGIWFIAENPSLRMVERATNPGGGPPTYEAQWYESRGDKLFREMLVKHGFKSGGVDTLGGWHCYVTNVIKEADYANRWNAKSQAERNQVAEVWSPVLSWELKNSNPKLVVIMGGKTNIELNYLVRQGLITLPETMKITHYAYIGQRPKGKLGPMHPQRIQEYDQEFSDVTNLFHQLNG